MKPRLIAVALLCVLAACGGSDKLPDGGVCCKVCTTGVACGDTCIAKGEACTVTPGCACNG